MRSLPIIAVLIMGGLLLSGHIRINFDHNLHLPKELTNKNNVIDNTSLADKFRYFSGNTYDVYLNDTVPNSASAYRDVVRTLNEADSNDLIVFHLEGYGGSVHVEEVLVNAIKTTKARTKMVVEGAVFSAHALLATSGDELEMRPYTFLMFHTSSSFGINCSNLVGKDRGITLEESCNNLINTYTKLINAQIDDNKYLTKAEKESIKSGHEVYITSEEYNRGKK